MRILPVLIALSFSVGSTSCYAGGYISPWLSSWYLGLSGSGVAGIQDPGTILINPASASWLAKPGLQLSGGLNWADVAFLRAGSFQQESTRTAAFSSLSSSFVWRKKTSSIYSWGLTVSSPYSLAVQWPQNWGGAFLAQDLFINSLFITPSASMKLGNRLSLGLGIGAGVTNISMSKEIDGPGGGGENLSGRSLGIRMHAGLNWHLSASARLGISYQSVVWGNDATGEATFTPRASNASFYPNTTFSLNLPGPAELRVGLAFNVDPSWELLIDAHYTQWKVLDTFRTEYAVNTELLTNDKQGWNWSNTLSIRAGSIWQIGNKAQIFIGASFDPSPVDNDRVSPLLPEGSRIGFSSGGSFALSTKFEVQIAGAFSTSGERLGFLEERNFGGTYQIQDISAQIGLNWRW